MTDLDIIRMLIINSKDVISIDEQYKETKFRYMTFTLKSGKIFKITTIKGK